MAGAAIHNDFFNKFIRAEVIEWQKLLELGSYAAARRQGTAQPRRRGGRSRDAGEGVRGPSTLERLVRGRGRRGVVAGGTGRRRSRQRGPEHGWRMGARARGTGGTPAGA